jgi:dihydroorotate dehydrogenase (fumarate)
MNLETEYLGLKLKNPFIVGASPMSDNPEVLQRLEAAGAAAIVMHSLFEEQITMEENSLLNDVESHADSFGEALNYFPLTDDYMFTPDQYIEQIMRIKQAVTIPLIASLNGVTPGGWVDYARGMEQAGADAIELNFYDVPTDPECSASDVEGRALEIMALVRENVKCPVAVKLSPFFSSLPHFASELVAAGANGLVFFNRFYQPDIDIEELTVKNDLHLSTSAELRLRLRWLAIVSAQVNTSYAATGGIHNATDALKSIMAGANAVQMVSVLLKRGPEYLQTVINEYTSWLLNHEYESTSQLHGCMNLKKTPDPAAFERGNYLRILQGWRS